MKIEDYLYYWNDKEVTFEEWLEGLKKTCRTDLAYDYIRLEYRTEKYRNSFKDSKKRVQGGEEKWLKIFGGE